MLFDQGEVVLYQFRPNARKIPYYFNTMLLQVLTWSDATI